MIKSQLFSFPAWPNSVSKYFITIIFLLNLIGKFRLRAVSHFFLIASWECMQFEQQSHNLQAAKLSGTHIPRGFTAQIVCTLEWIWEKKQETAHSGKFWKRSWWILWISDELYAPNEYMTSTGPERSFQTSLCQPVWPTQVNLWACSYSILSTGPYSDSC